MTMLFWFGVVVALVAAGLYLAMTAVHWFIHWMFTE